MLASARVGRRLAQAAEEKKSLRFELLTVLVFLAAMFAANIATSELYPRAWNDEAMWLDPAINLLRHNGLTSSTWYNSLFGQFWYGNTPLYVGVVFVWGKLAGDGFAALRSLNFILISVATLLLYWFASRSSEVTSARSRLALVLVPLLGYGVTFSYRSCRPDTLCLLLAVLLLLASTLRDPRLRRNAMVGVSAFFPWAGLQLVAYATIVCGLIVLRTGRRHMRTILWIGAGMAAGGCLMLGFYAAAGHLKEFMISTIGSQRVLFGQVGQYVLLGDGRGPVRFTPLAILNAVAKDPSSVLGVAAAAILFMSERVRRVPAVSHHLLWSLAAGLLIPLGMHFAGLYAIYYTWMALLPIWFFILAALDRLDASARPERFIAYTFLVLALLVGWPFLVGSAVLDAKGRDYGQVRQFVAQVVRPGEWACISPEAYFAVVETGAVPFLCNGYATARLAPDIPEDQRKRLRMIIATPNDAALMMARLSGQWVEVASLDVSSRKIAGLSWLYYDGLSDSYDLVAYSRAH